MAKKTPSRTPAPAYYEAVFKGSPKVVRGLLAGLILGSGAEADHWFHDDHDITDPTLPKTARRAAEKLHLLPVRDVRVVVTGELAATLRGLRRQLAASGPCELAELKRIRKTRVALRYHTYARRYDDEIRTLLRDLPRGVKLLEAKHEVTIDKEAKGVEAYAPAHHFESCGSGVLEGRFDTVLDLRNRLDVHPLIQCEELELTL